MKSRHELKERRVDLHQKEYRKKSKGLRWLIGIIVTVLLGALVYATYLYFEAKSSFDSAFDSKTSVKISSDEFNGKKPFAVLLMGTDTGALDRTDKVGNTDTIIVAVVNPSKKRYSLISIPRDTMAQMIGADKFTAEKINAAYPLGGARMSIDTVSKLLNIPLKYYVLVNMGGMMKMIRYVGGINIKPTLSFEYGGYIFNKGKLTHMGGAGALAYSRMRHDDPLGDYGRQIRQRQVINALIKKMFGMNAITNSGKILKSVSKNLKTNLTFNALQAIAVNYRKSTKSVKNDYLHGYSATIDGGSYQIQSTKELQRVSNYIRSELGLSKETINNNETFQNAENIANGFSFSSAETQEYHIYDYSGGD
ncbi:MAG: LCP family protein [Lactobacillus sp.]|nr:LCP family protein [Lactobacillus sp.]